MLSIVETVVIVVISCIFRTISFRSTNLVERVGLLTLIILGEGVIGVIRAIATTLINTFNITNSMAALGFGGLVLLVMSISRHPTSVELIHTSTSYGFSILTKSSMIDLALFGNKSGLYFTSPSTWL